LFAGRQHLKIKKLFPAHARDSHAALGPTTPTTLLEAFWLCSIAQIFGWPFPFG